MAASNSYDFVIAGGGTAGCVLASRLSQAGHSVVVVEAGGNDFTPQLLSPLGAPTLHESRYEWNYRSAPQKALSDRVVPLYGGKILSGSTGVNYGLWTRGHSADYDAWAKLVGDQRWSYASLLKYFKKLQTHHDPNGKPEMYGFDGPIHTTAGARDYPLRQQVFDALTNSGLNFNPDANGGNPLGFGAFTENWKDHQRQPASRLFDLSKATVVTNATIAQILLDSATATAKGIKLTDGREFYADKEVLVCCGSIKTPQLLMLSGIGPKAELSRHGIPSVADLPVGENLHDHCAGVIYWKLRHPERGVGMGHPDFMKVPRFTQGLPMEWIATFPMPDTSKAAKIDGMEPNDPLLTQPRGHAEIFVSYAPIGGGSTFHLDFDGTHISTPSLCLLPTSRGTVSLGSTDPTADPIIDPNYLATEWDREIMRASFRQALRAMLDTPAGKELVECETPPDGEPQLGLDATDEQIDARLRRVLNSFYQNAGTAAMGTVVNTDLTVKGVNRLRVVDASILPLPLAGHYQCPMYAISDAAADLILASA